jgi:hypothetical protein
MSLFLNLAPSRKGIADKMLALGDQNSSTNFFHILLELIIGAPALTSNIWCLNSISIYVIIEILYPDIRKDLIE